MKIYIVQVFAFNDATSTEVFRLHSDAVESFNSKIVLCKQESETLEENLENYDSFVEEKFFTNDEFTVLLTEYIVK